jgi:hypothetical protein
MPIRPFRLAAVLLLSALAWLPCAGVFAQQAITYQGELSQSGLPFTGQADLAFSLYDDPSAGSQVGPTLSRPDWPVDDGLFQVELDFGAGSFGAAPRWLEVSVDGTALAPRQPVSAAPVALYALDGASDSPWLVNGSAIAYQDGPVGIGTDTPAAALDVRIDSSIGLPQAFLVEEGDDFSRLSFGNTESSRFWTLAALTRGTNTLDDRFNLFHSTSGDVIRINGEGHVGLGAWVPGTTYRLAVSEGMMVSRDATTSLVPHLAVIETGSTNPVRQLFWSSSLSRGWRVDNVFDPAGPAGDRWSLVSAGTGGTGTQFSVLGSGLAGIGFTTPPSALAVRGRNAWTWDSGNGRGDFHVGDGDVGLSMGVALGGGGRGVSRIWTKGGVEHLFFGSAAHGLTLAMLPGQVGINTGSPSATLDVDGSAKVRDLSHGEATPRSVVADSTGNLSIAPLRQITVPAASFRPLDSTVPTFLSLDHVYVTTAGSSQLLAAPVVLPTGARIESVTAWVMDNRSDANLRLALTADALPTGTADTLVAILDSSGASTVRQAVSEPVSSHVVDAAAYQYYVQAFTTGGPWDGTSNLRIHAVIIDYRL